MEPRTFKKQMIPRNSGKKLIAKGIVLHETATPGATAQAEYNYFCSYTKANAHAFIDWVEDLQIVPWDIRAWHAGATANANYIGVEMCRPKTHDPEKFSIVYWATVDAFARIYCYILGIKVITTDNLMTHHEVTQKWRESTHTDPTAYFEEYGKNINQFRLDVQYALNKKWEVK